MRDGERLVPLCVDLDGTLLRADTLHECLLVLAKTAPHSLPRLLAWLGGGKAHFKHRVAEKVDFDVGALPYNDDVVRLVESARAEGRKVVLVTACSEKIARKIADGTRWFDDVMCSDRAMNLSHTRKADALIERYGAGGFDYVGNSHDDLPVFASARRGILVSSRPRLRRSAARANSDMSFIDAPGGGLRAWIKAIRVHQWLKNLLIFVPLLAAGAATDGSLFVRSVIAFAAFSLFASAVYVLNDLLDVSADRQHRSKRHRPFASGRLSIAAGLAAIPLLLVASVGLALLLSPVFLVVLVGYGLVTSAYSFRLKRQIVVDVMLLAGLYTIRILAGSAATGIQPSFWLLAFSMFIFLSLALSKRYSELILDAAQDRLVPGRGYMPSDLPVILALGSGSGLVSVLILAFYTRADIVTRLYPAEEWLWLVPPFILYWVCRLWMKAGRGELDEDPVVFAARDWQSLTIAAIVAALFILGGTGWWPF